MSKPKLLPILLIFVVLFSSLACSLTTGVTAFLKSFFPDIHYVKSGQTEIADCGSWANACDLQVALATATPGDEIWVQAGIYTPVNDSRFQFMTFRLINGVEIYGGFSGTEMNREQRDWVKNVTILSGDIDGDDRVDAQGVVTDTANIVGKNSHNVVTGNGVDATAVLDGFTITAGDSPLYGGGMTNYQPSASPTLRNIIFSGNRAADVGGGMFNYMDSNPSLTHVSFVGNSANHNGGALYNHASSPVLNDVTFTGNQAGNGAAMENYIESAPSLTNVTFSGNIASNKAGGMENSEDSSPNLNHVVFKDNHARYGAGMYNYKSSPTLVDVTFSGNVAGHVGGGMENESNANPTLTNVTFVGNRANHEGGGMFNTGSSPILVNVTFSGNVVTVDGGGGGMKNYYGSNPTLINVTFCRNVSPAEGAAISSYQSRPTIANAIIWGNTPQANQVQNEGASPVISFSLVQGGCSPGWLCDHMLPGSTNPLFVDVASGDLHLQATSAAIDAGNNSMVPVDAYDLDGDRNKGEVLPYDRDGHPRFVDMVSVDDKGQGKAPIIDLGAYETSAKP